METNNSKQPPALSAENKICGDTEQKLEALRRQIDVIDQQIVSLLAKRQIEVQRVISLKKAYNLPVYHPAREENLISDKRIQGGDAGLDPDYIEELYRLILRQSRAQQTARLAKKGIYDGASVLLVGGRGSMGQYFHRWFFDAGYDVRILDLDDWPNVDKLCAGIKLALISVPIEATTAVVRKLGPHLPADCVLADITSIKEPPLKAMLAAHQGPVIGLHPLFGPATSTMDKQIIVVTPGRDYPACQWLIDQFSAWGSILLQVNAKEHDDIMTIVQTLRHFATFAFGQFLCRKSIDLARTLEFSSPIYRLELGMVGRLFAQDSTLYSEIIFASSERRTILKDYLASVAENLPMIEKGDKEVFCTEFKKIANWFGPFSEQALRESTYLIDKLIDRF
ncbi:MAG: bifunctional chorismate mutase/prephenate dehydrogenase [Pseudomonadota bacterium]|uniref:chorismate mutase n=1 Tax=Candidatus Desulfatibia profunda TaxID=2841695 RepID=A0A8J6TG81_9BACT|nr:bifunctional chorismate mutase/prephenate dehydrogenase [Candidatus Desulfatibia profunda]MBL7179245.1 bifunctional chorismate mutase/prephenate dehydrogenase [Desulfobacterales bacterium]